MTAVTPQEPLALSVVVPVFNGESFIAGSVRQLVDYLAAQSYAAELIVVDDGSTDRTSEIVHETIAGSPVPAFLIRLERNQGKGAAIAAGMQSARGAHRIFLDADLAYPPEALAPIHAALEGADIAAASRAHPSSRLVLNPAFFTYYHVRHLSGRIFNAVIRLLLLPGVADSQAGLKGFRAAAAERLFSGWLPRGFSFDLALLFRGRRLGLRLAQVPVLYRQLDEPSTVRFMRDTGRMLRDLGLIRLRLVGDRFERLGSVFATRWVSAAETAGRLLRAPAGGPVVLTALGLGVILLISGRLVLESSTMTPLGWLVAVVALLVLAWRADLARPPRRPRLFRAGGERTAFLAVVALTALARFLWLGQMPPMEHGDSAECGLQGLALLEGAAPDVFSFSAWYNTPYLSYAPYALSFMLFDVSPWSLRLPSAIAGTAAVVPLYFLSRRWFGIRAAVLVGALYALSHPAIHFSRIGLWNVQVLFYEMAAFALLLGAIHRRSAFRAAAAGVISGLALYSYTGGRLIPVIVVAYLGCEALRDRRNALRTLAVYACGMIVAALPLALNYYQYPEVFAADRTASVWVLSEANRHHVASTVGTVEPLAVLWDQAWRTALGFVSMGDTSTQYGTPQPLLSPVTALLALGGVLVALWHWRQPRYQFLLLWLGLGLVLGSILILDPPSYTRLVGLFPLPYLLMAACLVAAVDWLRRHRPLRGAEIAAVYLLVIAQSGAFNLSGYYRFNEEMRLMSREWDVLAVFDHLGDDYDYYLFTGPFLLADAPVLRLFSAGTRAVSGFSETDLPDRLPRDSAFVLLPEFRRMGVMITERWPGVEREVFEEEGVRQMIVYRCSIENGCREGRT